MGTDRGRRHVWQVGYLIPRLLVAVCLVDIALRFMPIDGLTFRAWEAVTRYRPSGGAFEPNRHYYSERSYGNLAALGNLPDRRQYWTETFTVDALGFRNGVHLLNAPVSAILVGDSFAVGAGAKDDETLSSSLNKLGSCVVYNAGSEAWAVVPDQVLATAHRLNMRNRLVIRLYSEDADVPATPTGRAMGVRKLIASAPEEVRDLVGRVRGVLTVSPLEILSERALKALADDRILPNSYADTVVRATLYNGDSILFLAAFVNRFHRRREVASDYWRWLHNELREARFDLLVVLVPGKYRVYRPLLVNPRPVGQGEGDYLERLEHDLRAAGIAVLNLGPVLEAEAARALRHGEYLYWLDDIHWNARGIALAAKAVREQWPLTERSCGNSRGLVVQEPATHRSAKSVTTTVR